MNELKDEWKFDQKSGLLNTQPYTTYTAHVKNLQNTIVAQV